MVQIFRISYTLFKDASEVSTVYYYPQSDGYVAGTGNADIVYSTRVTASGDIIDFISTVLPNATLVYSEGDVEAAPTIYQTGVLQSQFDFTNNYIYIGKARPGVSVSTVGWTIERFELDSAGVVIDKKTTVQDIAIWANRGTEIYY